MEFGYVAKDLLGLGNGVYRVQPFLAQDDGPVRAGVGFNLQQRLGPTTPLGWFGRFGFGGVKGASSAANQVATGLVFQAPLKHLGLISGQPNDGMGLAVCWSEPFRNGANPGAYDETSVELGYCFHLTPLIRIQPDLQFVIDPAYNPQRETAVVFQLQLDVNW
jgi:porin